MKSKCGRRIPRSKNSIRHLVTILFAIIVTQASVMAQMPEVPPLFREIIYQNIPPVTFGAAAWGDFDGDGDFDLIYTGNRRTFDNPLPFGRIFINLGDGSIFLPDPAGGEDPIELSTTEYTEFPNVSSDVWRGSAAWGDFDNDGDLDALITGISESGIRETSVIRYISDFSAFQLYTTVPGVSDGAVKWFDYDNDGDLDFIQTGENNSSEFVTELYENVGESGGRFMINRAASDIFTGVSNSEIAIGDYDNDGDMDLLIAGTAQPQEFVTLLYRNDGDGAFRESGIQLRGLLEPSVAWGDKDSDGDLDILLSGGEIDPFVLRGTLLIYENDGGSFSSTETVLIGSFSTDLTLGRYRGSAGWGDVDNDGSLDFFITGSRRPAHTQSGQVYINQSSGAFIKSPYDFSGGSYTGGENGISFWGDYDSDNDLDLFVVGTDPNRGNVVMGQQNYLSELPETPRTVRFPVNSRPDAPSSLGSSTATTGIQLSWAPGTDTETPTPALTYNVRVGTSPGGIDVFSPMSNPATGLRYVSAMGNAGHNTNWNLYNLAPGTYYWSVQSIDTSYTGSRFSGEASFTIE